VRRRKKQVWIRGVNKDYNYDLKGLFKAAAIRASVQPGPLQEFYQRSLTKGIKQTMGFFASYAGDAQNKASGLALGQPRAVGSLISDF
jgi:hypothetical protein